MVNQNFRLIQSQDFGTIFIIDNLFLKTNIQR